MGKEFVRTSRGINKNVYKQNSKGLNRDSIGIKRKFKAPIIRTVKKEFTHQNNKNEKRKRERRDVIIQAKKDRHVCSRFLVYWANPFGIDVCNSLIKLRK